jgi:hypothetical protein
MSSGSSVLSKVWLICSPVVVISVIKDGTNTFVAITVVLLAVIRVPFRSKLWSHLRPKSVRTLKAVVSVVLKTVITVTEVVLVVRVRHLIYRSLN